MRCFEEFGEFLKDHPADAGTRMLARGAGADRAPRLALPGAGGIDQAVTLRPVVVACDAYALPLSPAAPDCVSCCKSC